MKLWKKTEIAEWIVILVIFVSVTYPKEMIYLSETSLGKLFFVMVIVFFTTIDPLFGFVACVVVIAYYQMDLYHGFIELHRDTLFLENMQSVIAPDTPLENLTSVLDGYFRGDDSVFRYEPFATTASTNPLNQQPKTELMSYFRSEHCKDGKLEFKGMPVPYEMADHVFRELRFPDGNKSKCNPCDKSCKFDVTNREDRLQHEERMVRPKSSKDEAIDWNKLVATYVVAPINSIAMDMHSLKQTFATYIESV
jgi:hypothetical protein